MKNNLWKKGFCILACATLLTSMATDAVLPDYVYAATTKEPIQVGDNVYASLDDLGTLTISGTGDMWANTHMAGIQPDGTYGFKSSISLDNQGTTCPWFGEFQDDINEIVFAEGVTSVGDNATSVCETVKVYKVRDQVVANHFDCSGLPALTKVTFSSTIKTIGRGAFFHTKALKKISIPMNVQEIEEYAFCGSGLQTVKLSDGLEKIGEHAFEGTKLTGVNIPGSVRNIESYAFSNVTNATINAGTKVIKKNAFGKVNATFYSKDVVITEGAFSAGSLFKCYKGSSADTYAANHGISVKYITDKPSKAKKPKVSSKNKKLYISCKTMTGVDGYKIRYATNKSMKNADTESGKKITLVGLKKGKKYYVQVCAYKKNSSGKKVYGAWSDIVTVKIK